MAIKDCNVHAYMFKDYWEDIGTIKSFFDANMALTAQSPKFQFYDPSKPIYTSPQYLPPTKYESSKVCLPLCDHLVNYYSVEVMYDVHTGIGFNYISRMLPPTVQS